MVTQREAQRLWHSKYFSKLPKKWQEEVAKKYKPNYKKKAK